MSLQNLYIFLEPLDILLKLLYIFGTSRYPFGTSNNLSEHLETIFYKL